jgi:predicted nucleic acid-binding protein
MAEEEPAGRTWVLDASVAVQLVLEEPGSEAAAALLAGLRKPLPPRFLVPDHFWGECADALRKGVLRGRIGAAEARRETEDLLRLDLESVPVRSLAADALELAGAEGITVYDACYVVLADRTGATLVTADRVLRDRLRGSRHRVRLLAGETGAGPPPGPTSRRRR